MLNISKYVKEKNYIKCAHVTDLNPNTQVSHQILTFGYTIKASTHQDSAESLNTADSSQRDEKDKNELYNKQYMRNDYNMKIPINTNY